MENDINYDYQEEIDKLIPKTNMYQYKWLRNKPYKQMLNIDYFDGCFKDLDHNIIENNKVLYSISRITRGINDAKFYNVPKVHLDKAKQLGSELMSNFEYFKNNRPKNINEMSFSCPEARIMFIDFINMFQANKIKIYEVEKFVKSGMFCGYLDMIASINGTFRIIEIKTRSENNLRDSDILQAHFYELLTGLKTMLIIYNKKTRKFNFYQIRTKKVPINKKIQLPLWKFNEFLEMLGLEQLRTLDLYKPKIGA